MTIKKKDLEVLKALLEEEKKKLLRHLEEISDSSVADLENPTGDSVDIAALEINQNALQKIGKRELYLVKKIETALQKIEEGTYGECETCGEDIGVPRLMARPVAQLCIDCKTEQESIERRYSNREADEDTDAIGDEAEEV